MDTFLIAGIFLIIAIFSIILFLIVFIFSHWTFIFGAGFNATPKKIIRKMFEMAELKEGETVYDLGTGDGRALIIAALEFRAKGVGIEISPLRYLWAKINVFSHFLSKEIKIKYGNFLKIPISDADLVFIFLSNRANKMLVPKFKKELKKGARIVSYIWQVPEIPLIKEDKKNKIYLYQIV
jgi:tRNA A58 N-methylase Trm61